MKASFFCTCLLSLAVLIAGCGGEDGGTADPAGSNDSAAGGLSAEQLEHGIGPITAFDFGELDAGLAATGQQLFEIKCSACHKFDQRYVGPSLGGVLDRRSPAFVMNMMLNPEQMLAEHPEAKRMLAEYMSPMANQNLIEEEARAIVEYFRIAGQQGS